MKGKPATRLGFHWPSPPLHVVLVHPEIPPNTGNIARLCAATGSVLHLVEPLGFRLNNRELRRAGLDYWDAVEMRRHADFSAFLGETKPEQVFLFSTGGRAPYATPSYRPGDALVFGSETAGLPKSILERYPDRILGIPMRAGGVRSLNLATAAGIVLYEALRQIDAAKK